MDVIKTVLRAYHFECDTEDSVKEYKAFCRKIIEKSKKVGARVKKFRAWSGSISNDSAKLRYIKNKYDGKTIELETKWIFNNQWNTVDGKRVFDWFEQYLPKSKIKTGYYLEQTEEIVELRKDTFKCRYCGKRYTRQEAENLKYCKKCLGSEYLKEKEVHITNLKCVLDGEQIPLSKEEEAKRLEEYKVTQKEAWKKRVEKEINNRLNKIEKKKLSLTKEKEFLELMVENDLGYFVPNTIYYDHKDEFCIGWMSGKKLSKEETELIAEKISSEAFKKFNVKVRSS